MGAAQAAGRVYALLADGSTVEIRLAGPVDVGVVRAMYEAMSADNLRLDRILPGFDHGRLMGDLLASLADTRSASGAPEGYSSITGNVCGGTPDRASEASW